MPQFTDKQRKDAAILRYEEAAHAMQSGVFAEMQHAGYPPQAYAPDPAGANLKHLRVGVNSALVETSALSKLLMDKGVFTEVEYYESLADAMEVEKARFEKSLSEKLGRPISLG